MSEPEGQELQDKLGAIWYVMDQYQRDVEQWHDQKRKLKEKKEYLEMNGTTSKVITSVVVLFALFYLLLGLINQNFSSFFTIVLLSGFYLLMRKTHEKLAKVFLIILVLTVIQGAQILVQGIMSGDLVAYLILALLIPLTIFAIRTGLRGNRSYIDKYNEHVRQYNEPYLQKMIQLQEDGAKQDKALKELTNGWFPSAYLSPNVVLTFIPMILGHNNDEVVAAVKEAVERGISFGSATEAEIVIAEEIRKLVPAMEEVRLVSSGTEAGMSAIRLARGYTGRDKIVKFEGCYHGHSDSLLVKAGSGLLTFGNPSSSGVPASVTEHTLVLEYNNPQQLEEAFARYGDEIACVIVEAVAGNMNLVRATPEFIRTMRELCTKHGALLIVDEVMTGFRVALGGAQSLYGVTPDITMLGKVIGGGMPVAAFGARADIMQKIAPCGPVYQAGTLSGNPVAVACGMATLKQIQRPGFYDELSAQTNKLTTGLTEAAREAGVPFYRQDGLRHRPGPEVQEYGNGRREHFLVEVLLGNG